MSGPRDDEVAALRRELAEARAEIRLLKRRLNIAPDAGDAPRELIDELRQASPRKTDTPAGVTVKLGRRIGLWRSPVVLGLALAVLTAFAVDAAVAVYQRNALREARQARLVLENTAMRSLFVEMRRIVADPDGRSYRMTVAMQNTNPGVTLYVMLNAVSVYVQVGTAWLQVPSRPSDGVSWGVVKLTDAHAYDVVFSPEVPNWAELIPGYMHVRIQADMLVSERAEPGDDVVERRTPYYVYLKPHGANDEEIRRRNRMSGPPPVFIPMPPH
ncbi:hypothetical protein BH10PSE6_BH10PSE6_06770 [soil metagenome]